MNHFTAHRLRVVVEARGHVELNEHQGSAIRGALFHALRNRFCGNREAAECAACPLITTCPVATLVSTLDPEGQRGRDVPRPFTIQPPIANGESQIANRQSQITNHKSPITMGHFAERDDGSLVVWYAPGEQFEFGLTLFAQAMQLFPYVVLALSEFERGGIGRRTQQPDGNWRRGLLAVREVWAENPLTGERQAVLRSGDRMVHVPDIPITHQQVTHHASRLTSHASRLTLHFLTPTRLVEKGHLLKPDTFQFQPLFQRLIERLEALSAQFCDTPLRYEQTRPLIEAAAHVRVVENRLRWEEVRSYSTRRRAESPTSGLLGRVTLQADDWSPFLPWLLWGQFTHVGKDAVKGNGWYEVEKEEQGKE